MNTDSHDLPLLRLGRLRVSPPVVLAPMAGITNYPFRALCRRFGAGLLISEMITARPLVEGREKTARLAAFGPEESPRSIQIYGTDPEWVGRAVGLVVSEDGVDHVDLNFGCPVRKVTRKGGGAALPARPELLRSIVRSAVEAAGEVPVTIKFRIGIDDRIVTFLESGRIAEEEGCAGVTLHARTAAQLYDGAARWEAIAELKRSLSIPVIGNGDVFSAGDALRMIEETGCDGIAVGRGCLGRPWIFRDLAEALAGRPVPSPPSFGEVADIMLEHAVMLIEWFDEPFGLRSFRKHAGWYTRGFRGSAALRNRLMQVETLDQLRTALEMIDREEPYPAAADQVKRGKKGGTQRVVLPEGFLDSKDSAG